ncbi:hypothetical protein HYV43_01430 [Candidatus Micrarchaeota archaeon]|nr:hypothetical protein [Candidatus Micrarchaeota archaeon]
MAEPGAPYIIYGAAFVALCILIFAVARAIGVAWARKALAEEIEADEKILANAEGYSENINPLKFSGEFSYTLTDRRLMFKTITRGEFSLGKPPDYRIFLKDIQEVSAPQPPNCSINISQKSISIKFKPDSNGLKQVKEYDDAVGDSYSLQINSEQAEQFYRNLKTAIETLKTAKPSA